MPRECFLSAVLRWWLPAPNDPDPGPGPAPLLRLGTFQRAEALRASAALAAEWRRFVREHQRAVLAEAPSEVAPPRPGPAVTCRNVAMGDKTRSRHDSLQTVLMSAPPPDVVSGGGRAAPAGGGALSSGRLCPQVKEAYPHLGPFGEWWQQNGIVVSPFVEVCPSLPSAYTPARLLFHFEYLAHGEKGWVGRLPDVHGLVLLMRNAFFSRRK